MEYSRGIYGYLDTKYDKFVYFGKDSHIDKNARNKEHHQPSRYDKQPINRILQNNIGRYEYRVLEKDIESEADLNELEIAYIEKYDTYENWFNYTEGGENSPRYWLGKKRSEETKRKISESKKGQIPWMKGKHHSEESKKKMSESKKGQIPWMKGKKHKPETKKKMSKYTIWDTEKCHYSKNKMYRGKRDGSEPSLCFMVKYDSKDVPIGMNMDFTTCEIIHDLIKEMIE